MAFTLMENVSYFQNYSDIIFSGLSNRVNGIKYIRHFNRKVVKKCVIFKNENREVILYGTKRNTVCSFLRFSRFA